MTKKKILIVLIAIVLISSLIVGTYSYFTVSNSDNTTISGTADSASLDLTVSKIAGDEILVPQLTDYLQSALTGSCIDANGNTACQVYEIVLTNSSNSAADLTGTITLSAPTYSNLKWELLKSSTEVKSSRDTKSSTQTDLVSKVTLEAGASETYYLAIWIAETGDNQSSLDSGKFTGVITFDSMISSASVSASLTGTLVTEKVKALATSTPTQVYSISQAATSQTSATTEYRYWGESPSNYVWFNCSATDSSNNAYGSDSYTYSTDTCEKWRIIGSFEIDDGSGSLEYRAKIIRNDSIGSYSWDNSSNTSSYGNNNWANARLMQLLNPGYSSEYIGGSLYYRRTDGTCYSGRYGATTGCSLSISGLKITSSYVTSSYDLNNFVGDAKWYIGGQNKNQYMTYWYNRQRSNNVYESNSKSWTGLVGLMYGEDYGFAAGNDCAINESTKKYSYNSNSANDLRSCKTNNWLFNGDNQWTLSPLSTGISEAAYVTSSGALSLDSHVYSSYTVRPVLYLKSNVSIVDGEGTAVSPYILGA